MLQATYPLDTLRLRLAVDPASRSVAGAAAALMREGSHRAFFRGLGASMLGLFPSSCRSLCMASCRQRIDWHTLQQVNT